MKNISKIYARFTEANVKLRVLPLLLPVQNIIFALIVLIFANVIISKGKINGEMDYLQIKLFYNLVIAILFIIVSIFAPYFLSSSVNGLAKNNVVLHLLSVKIKESEIVFATFLRGLVSVVVLLFSAFPIACISFYFGGASIAKLIRLVVCLLSYTLLLSTISLYISTMIMEQNLSRIFASFVSTVLLVLHIIFVSTIISNNLNCVLYLLITVVISLVLLAYAKKGTVFSIYK